MRENRAELGAAFSDAYASLNAAQKQAVDIIEGPVMVIAGPGTGKTQILTLRIANILLQTDTAPESILALTFTESGAKAMRERLHRYVGSRAYQVPIYTFHGFADRLIREYPDAYERVIGGRPASELEKIALIESILDTVEVKKLRPSGNPAYYVTPILREIAKLKQEYIGPDQLVNLIATQETELADTARYHEKGAHKGKERGEYTKLAESIEKNRELAYVYRAYEAALREARLYDFDDMISETVSALSANESMLRDLQELYQYVLADEHQDVNGSQNRILELLASYHDQPNIFVVGDEKQAIYRFQGASLDNFLYFQDRFVGTTVIQLTENYRSGQSILDIAHSLVAVEEGPLAQLRIPLTAAAVSSSIITRKDFSHQAIEDSDMVATVQAVMADGVPPAEIAIIVRTNREVESCAAQLRKAGIAVAASADSDILEHPITQAVEGLLRAVLTDRSEAALFAVLHGAYWGLSTADLIKIASAQRYDTSLMELLTNRTTLEELSVEHIDEAMNVATVLATAREREVTEPPHRVLEYVLTASGFLDHVMIHDPHEGVRVLRRLYDEVEALVLRDGVGTLRSIMDMFTRQRAYGIALNAPHIATGEQAVVVMTAHKSKGLEFDTVFIPHLEDSIWGGSAKRTLFKIPLGTRVAEAAADVIDDERRLFYVAITRAKTRLFLSTSETNADGRAYVPTRLFDALDSSLMVTVDTAAAAAAFAPETVLRPAPENAAVDPALLTTILRERGFSATSLNNYLKNPWDYLYRNVLRIPEVQATHLQFGTAVHSVLEYVTHTYTATGVVPDTSAIKARLETALGRLPLSVTEYTRLLDKGWQSLIVYIEHLTASLPKATREELSIRVLLPTGIPELPELPLTGKLDRIDLNERGQAIRVVDYKTGKPKTRNVIEGKTATSDGGYKRQLTFYALLLSLYGDERYLTNTGVLSFVEPDAKGVIHEESFTITEEEVAALREEIIAAAASIMSGDFLGDQAAAAASEYAHLAERFFSA